MSMMFWFLIAALTAAVTILLARPLLTAPARSGQASDTVLEEAAHDIEVYRDQLDELQRDRNSGLISEGEAEIAHAEIARRLLKVSARQESLKASSSAGSASVWTSPWRWGAALVILAVPLIAVASYLQVGSPGMPAQPLASRSIPSVEDNIDMATLIEQAEAFLADNPDDGRGWDVLAPIYMRVERYDAAVKAYRNAIRVLGSTAERQGGLGEALVAQSNGVVSEDARTAFQAAALLQPDNPRSEFFLALALAQEGRQAEAIDAFRKLESTSPAQAPWVPLVRAQLAQLGQEPGPTLALPPVDLADLPGLNQAPQGAAGEGAETGPDGPPRDGQGQAAEAPAGPSAEDVAAARQMSAEERMEMIRAMVAGLDQRLSDDPDDIEGWQRLVRSYMVLGETGKAAAALERALSAFPGDSENARTLAQLGDELGLSVPAVTQ